MCCTGTRQEVQTARCHTRLSHSALGETPEGDEKRWGPRISVGGRVPGVRARMAARNASTLESEE